jgi:hypothetical protein
MITPNDVPTFQRILELWLEADNHAYGGCNFREHRPGHSHSAVIEHFQQLLADEINRNIPV